MPSGVEMISIGRRVFTIEDVTVCILPARPANPALIHRIINVHELSSKVKIIYKAMALC